MSQQSVSDFDIIEGNNTMKSATHLTMIVNFDIGGCDDDNNTNILPCEHKSYFVYKTWCKIVYIYT